MRISGWSSDVCSSDLLGRAYGLRRRAGGVRVGGRARGRGRCPAARDPARVRGDVPGRHGGRSRTLPGVAQYRDLRAVRVGGDSGGGTRARREIGREWGGEGEGRYVRDVGGTWK